MTKTQTIKCPAICSVNGRRCESSANHGGNHDFIGVPHTQASAAA